MEDFKEYMNQSVVEARKMKRGQYNVLRDWVLPENESADDLGWLVVNKSVSERNVDGYDGYVSWLPEEAFEEIYEEIQPAHDGFFFGQALRRLALGDCVQRRGWNGKGMYLFLVDGDAVNQALYNYLDDPDNTKTTQVCVMQSTCSRLITSLCRGLRLKPTCWPKIGWLWIDVKKPVRKHGRFRNVPNK